MSRRSWWFIAATLALVGFLAGGWTTVGPGEVVVVRRLGQVIPLPWQPGWHWSWPLGIDRLTWLRPNEIRRVEFGWTEPARPFDEPGLGDYLTGDRNLIRVRGVVQYRIGSPILFVLRSNDLDHLLNRLIESSLAKILSSRAVDATLRSGRQDVAGYLGSELHQKQGRLGLGLSIVDVSLTDARPPLEVEPAFLDAQTARSARDRKILEARSLAGTIRPQALATAETTINTARAEADRGVAIARAQAERFLAILAEASLSRPLTVRRLYRDMLRDLLPRVRRKMLMTADEPIDLGVIDRGSR